jgi:hypothetical protein
MFSIKSFEYSLKILQINGPWNLSSVNEFDFKFWKLKTAFAVADFEHALKDMYTWDLQRLHATGALSCKI